MAKVHHPDPLIVWGNAMAEWNGGLGEVGPAQPGWKGCWKKVSGFGVKLEDIHSIGSGERYGRQEELEQRLSFSLVSLQLSLISTITFVLLYFLYIHTYKYNIY